MPSFPPKEKTTVCFAHVAYQLAARFALRNTGVQHFQVWNRDDMLARIGEADVLVCSMMWHDDALARSPRLGFVQSVGAGTDQFPKDKLKARGVRLASARGVNVRAVSEHALGLILALTRRLGEARDNQMKRHWRGMISDIGAREDELGGKTIAIVGLGGIGDRLAHLCKALDMRVIGLRSDPAKGKGHADEVHGIKALSQALPQADIVALCCPLTPETERLIGAKELGLMKPSAYLVNVARGKVVDEPALVQALSQNRIAGAGIDLTAEEPLAPTSSLWSMPHVILTPHTAGETQKYEDNVVDVLLDNLARLWRGEGELRNQVV